MYDISIKKLLDPCPLFIQKQEILRDLDFMILTYLWCFPLELSNLLSCEGFSSMSRIF